MHLFQDTRQWWAADTGIQIEPCLGLLGPAAWADGGHSQATGSWAPGSFTQQGSWFSLSSPVITVPSSPVIAVPSSLVPYKLKSAPSLVLLEYMLVPSIILFSRGWFLKGSGNLWNPSRRNHVKETRKPSSLLPQRCPSQHCPESHRLESSLLRKQQAGHRKHRCQAP